MNISIPLFSSRCHSGLDPESISTPFLEANVTKMLQLQNEPKTNPNEPNFSEAKPHSKPKNQHFRQIYENLFMQNEPNGMFNETNFFSYEL